jgi:HEPN superfamily AbiU2-like protein
MTAEEFKRQLVELRKIIWDGVACYWAWRELVVEDKETLTALNRYHAFFYPARASLLIRALLQFSKALDSNTRTVSLRKLLAEAKKDHQNLMPCAADGELDKIAAQIDEDKPLLQSLKSLRDQRIAHHDAFRSTDAGKLRVDDVQKLMEDIVSMFNALSNGHDGGVTDVSLLKNDAEWHTSEIVRIMREEMERHI